LLRAKILERQAYLSSRTGQNVFRGAWAGLRVPLILAAAGYRCSWKHLALPITCVLPLKRARTRKPVDYESPLQHKPATQAAIPRQIS
jgi:hypothetical protein